MRYTKTKSKKKCVKKPMHIKNKKRLRSKKIRQSGGGPFNSIMNMIPFMPKSSGNNNSMTNSNNMTEMNNNQTSQNVLVGALCNQYVKNNIKGNNTSTYDAVLDNLCSNERVGLPARFNTVYSSNSLSQNNVANYQQTTEIEPKSNNDGDFEMPSFLSGVKGFAKLYSTPLRMGMNAIKGLTTGRASQSSSSHENQKEEKLKKIKRSKKLRNKKKKKSKKKHRYHDEEKRAKEETLEEQISRAEREIEEEKKNNKLKIVETIKNGLENNININGSKVLKK